MDRKNWIIYDVRKGKGPRDPRPFRNYEVPQEFTVTLQQLDDSSCDCTYWIELSFENEEVVAGRLWMSGCPAHEGWDGRELTKEEKDYFKPKILSYLRGEVSKSFRPIHLEVWGIYEEYEEYLSDNPHTPYHFLINKKAKTIQPIEWKAETIETNYRCCPCCVEGDYTCDWFQTREGIPRCLATEFPDYRERKNLTWRKQ